MKKQTFDPVAYAAERDRQAAERREKYERIKAYENTIRATAPNGSAIARLRVIENNNHRHYTYTDVNGPRDDVYAYVSYLFSTDHVVQCYEHMALSLYDIIEHGDDTITARLSKNYYAGD